MAVTYAGTLALANLMLTGCRYQASISDTTDFDDGSVQGAEGQSALAQREQPVPTVEELLEIRVTALLDEMSLEHRVAQMFIVRPEYIVDGVGVVVQAGEQTREALKNCPVGGLIYFSQNLVDTEQAKAMLANTIQYGLEANGIPPFLCVDEEGGTVSRIGGNPGFDAINVGDMADIGASGDPELARSMARYVAEYLKPLGFNVDFAPVCDVANNPESDTMRWRSFGDDPNLVARMVAAQVEGFLQGGMMCSAKHFPGIGAAVGDSHNVGITSSQTAEGLLAFELVPFESAIQAGVPFVMVGHISLPLLTGDATPACLSPSVVQGILRDQLGYEGLIVTDSLGMAAVDDYYTVEESAVAVLQAGCDIVLLPADLDAAISGVLVAINAGELDEERIGQSVRRILRTKLTFMEEHFR
jgi:beta-N-acetylhexosaminidase